MTDIKMLPLPGSVADWLRRFCAANGSIQSEVIEGWFQHYARAVAEHNVAARDAEIEALRAEVEAFRASADGDASVHVGIERDLAVTRAERAEAEVEKLRLLCQSVHDRLLRGDDDAELLAMLEEGWAALQERGE